MARQEHLSPGKYKLAVDDYLRLDETGVFGTHRTELLGGDIIIMNAESRPHGRIRENPVDHAYRDRRDVAFGERLTAATMTGLTIDTGSF